MSERDIMDMLLKLSRKVDRIDERLAKANTKPEKKTWVKASTVRELTGWDYAKMLAHRRNKTIIWKRDNGIWYLLESIPERLQIHKTTVYDNL
jgi:hypothetical protein